MHAKMQPGAPMTLARQQYLMLVRSLPWDFQSRERETQLIEYCESIGLTEANARALMWGPVR